MEKRLFNALFYLTLLAIIILSFYLFHLIKLYNIICLLFELILPVFFGYALAWLLHPLYKKMSKKLNKNFSFILILISLALIYLGIILLIVPIFIQEAGHLLDLIKDYLPKIKSIPFLKINTSNLEIKPEMILDKCGGLISIIVNFLFTHIFGFYILYNYTNINNAIKKNIPIKYKDKILKFLRKLSINMYEYIKGTLIDTAILFIISLILFTAFKFKYSILIAFIISITNIIPFIGPYIGGIPAILIGLSINLKRGVIALCIVIFCQTVESNIINPIIMSRCIKINPILIIIAITIMGKFFGIIGMAFAIPILIFIKILLEFIQKYKK